MLWKWLWTRLAASSGQIKIPTVRRRRSRGRGCRLWLEELERRLAPAVALTYGGSGTALTLNELVNGATPSVTISDSGTTLTINLNGGFFDTSSTGAATGLTYSVAGNPGASHSATINISAANNITTLFTNLPGDFLTLGPLNDTNGGVGNLNMSANSIFVPASDTIDTSNATVGAGNIALTAATSIDLNLGSTVLAKDGSITLLANQGTPTGGNFIAISIDGGTVETTGAGNILFQGTGGNETTGGNHSGILVSNSGGTGGTVEATGTGSVTLTGTGGQGAGGNLGVDISGANTVVTSAGGKLSITGQGGPGSAANSFDVGVQIGSGAQVTTTGGANIAITGSGGAGTGADFGVDIGGANTLVSSAGSLQITGSGGAGSAAATVELGIDISGGAQVIGTGAVSLSGQGGQGTDADFGVLVDGSNGALVQSAASIQITGSGGGTGSASNEDGVIIDNAAQVTGTAVTPITITGTAGQGTGNFGVNITDSGTALTSQGGNVLIAGSSSGGTSTQIANSAVVSTIGGGTMTLNGAQNVAITSGASISTVDGALTVLANQGPTPAAGNFIGINVYGGTLKTTGVGNLLLQGRGGNDTASALHIGVFVQVGAMVQATGSGSITLNGTGGQGTNNNAGVAITGSATQVTTAAGNITLTGTGGNGSSNVNTGINILGGATISAAGGGPGTGIVTLTGTGGGGTDDNIGVVIQNANTSLTAANALTITGTSGSGSTTTNIGVAVASGAHVSVTGSGPLTITGSGGTGTASNFGVDITDMNTAVTATSGPIAITATAGAGSTALTVASSAQITGTSSTPITLTGDSMSFNTSIAINNSGNVVTLQPQSAGTQINLGGNNAAGVLGLSADLLNNRINTGALHIGNVSAGAITVSATIQPNLTPTLTLLTGAGISETSSGVLNIANLRTASGGPVTLSGANTIGTFAARANGAVTLHDVNNGLVIGQVENVPGITTSGGNVTLTVGGQLDIGTGAGEGITAPGGIVDLDAPGVVENSPSIISSSGLRLQGTGTFTLSDGNAVSNLAANTTGSINFVTAGPLTVGPLLGTPGLSSGNNSITLQTTAGGLTLNGPIAAGTGTLDLTVAGAISSAGSGSPAAAAALAIHSASAVGSAANPVNTALGNLAVSAGSGGVFLVNTGNLTITTVNAVPGVTAAGGAISISTTGTLTVAQPVITGTTPGDDITLSGNGTININASLTGNTATVNGGNTPDAFTVTPSTTTAITVNGNLPTPPASPGDSLDVIQTGLTNPVLTDSFDPATGLSGTWSFGNAAPVHFTGIETLLPVPASIGDQTVSYTQGSFTALVTPGSTVTIAGSMAYFLDRSLGLSFAGTFYQNYLGLQEKWLAGNQNQFGNRWYYITPDGRFFAWDGTAQSHGSVVLATLDPVYYAYPDLIYQATQATLDVILRDRLGLIFTGNFYQNYGGRNEKWLAGIANQYGNPWYFIDTVGRFYAWDGSPNQATGTLLASLDPLYWAQPTRLYNAQPGEVSAAISGGVLQITTVPDWAGQVVVQVTGTNPPAQQTFTVSFVDHAPVLTPIVNQTTPQNTPVVLNVSATDADNDTLTFSAVGGHLGYVLEQSLGLRLQGSLFFNYGGANEEWLQSRLGNWYFIKPDGSLWQWDGTLNKASGTLVASLDPIYYYHPDLLYRPPVGDLAFAINQDLNLMQESSNFSLNYGGQNEKWLLGNDGWYFIKPDGTFWKWDGTQNQATGTLMATLDPDYYTHIQRLYQATTNTVMVGVTGNTLTLTPAANFIGQFWVLVQVSDGAQTVSEMFELTVT